MAADIRRGRLLYHGCNSARGGYARSALCRARAVCASGRDCVRQEFAGVAIADQSGVSRATGRQKSAQARLKRFTTHQSRSSCGRGYAFAHHGASQRTDAVDQVKSQSPRALCGQKIAQQCAIEEIDRERAAAHVGAPQTIVGSEHFGAADVLRLSISFDRKFADCCRIAQTQIETLCPDRRNDMGSFTDKRNAPVCEPSGRRNAKRKTAACRFGFDLPENRIRCSLDFRAQLHVIE